MVGGIEWQNIIESLLFAEFERIMLFMEVEMGVEKLFRQNIIERGLTLKNVGQAMRCKLD